MAPTAKRVALGLGAVTLTVPAVISVGAITFSLIPVLRVGVQPMTNFMVEADGLVGIFFFVFFFGAPIAAVLGTLVYATFHWRLQREPPLARRWALLVPVILGAVLLPPVWVITTPSAGILPYVGPATLGGVAGAAAGAIFWHLSLRNSTLAPAV